MNKEKEASANVPTPNELENQASASRNNNEASTSTENREKNREESIVHGGSIDFSRVPIPICSCTGVRRECQKLAGGWRSTCCTADLAEYPQPSTSSRGKGRIKGRTISKGAYEKILERLVAEGHDLLWGVDLKNHWVHPEKHKPRSYHHHIISLSMNKEKEAAANVPIPNESENQASASINNNEASTSTENRDKNREESIVHGGSIDFSRVPIPVCSCTGVRRECQKLAGGWRSTCCTADLAEYPLPSTSSRGKGRIKGRTISKGAYEKILERLAAEGHGLLWGVDLKNHWVHPEKHTPRYIILYLVNPPPI